MSSRELIKPSDQCAPFFQFFLMIQSEKIKNDYVYLSWLARCCTCTQLLLHVYCRMPFLRIMSKLPGGRLIFGR